MNKDGWFTSRKSGRCPVMFLSAIGDLSAWFENRFVPHHPGRCKFQLYLGDPRTACQLAIPAGTLLGGDQTMMDPKQFADKQLELVAEFAQYIADHPEVDNLLPEKSHICFQ